MTQSPRRSFGLRAVLGGTVLALGAMLAVAPAVAQPARADDGGLTACAVQSAEFGWGVKESFRSYISGSIANGTWETSDGASYATPQFHWKNGTGSVGTDLASGTVSFTGAVHFTGHDGALQFDLANPAIEFSDGSATLLLTIGATDQAQSGAPKSAQVRAGKIDTASLQADGSAFSLKDAKVRLTSEGATAFNGQYGDYVAGDELDPITVTGSVEPGCALAVGATTPSASPTPSASAQPSTKPAPVVQTEAQIPWVPIAIGGVALVVIGVTVGMLVAGRGKKAAPTTEPAADETPADPQS